MKDGVNDQMKDGFKRGTGRTNRRAMAQRGGIRRETIAINSVRSSCDLFYRQGASVEFEINSTTVPKQGYR